MEKLNSILQSYVAVGEDTKDKILGAAFVVVNKDGIIYHGSAGRIDVPVDSPPFTVDSFTWIASMTKIITTTCIMRVVEQGHLSLDADARDLVPQLAAMQILRGFDADGKPILENNTTPITVRQLVTHTTGLGYDIADPDLVKWSKSVGRTASNLEFTLDGWNTPVKFTPGQGWYYGSAVDWAAQAMLASVAKARSSPRTPSLSDCLAENVLTPLGMHDTTFYPIRLQESGQTKDRTVSPSSRNPEAGTIISTALPVPMDPPTESGGAGLWSTCADHAKVLQELLVASGSASGSSGGSGGRVLKKESVDEMFRPQLDDTQRAMLMTITDAYRDGFIPEFEPGMPLDHGLGGLINLEDAPGKRRAGSMKWLGMANGHWWIDRTTGIAASLVVNIVPCPDAVVNTLYDELERAVYGELLTDLGE